jgi:hypothetical protein
MPAPEFTGVRHSRYNQGYVFGRGLSTPAIKQTANGNWDRPGVSR